MEEACEMYSRAANMFKMAKNWSGACGCFNSPLTTLFSVQPLIRSCIGSVIWLCFASVEKN